ncbi:hypothetical protein [Peribacillus sp. TH24]|nr:hypothetical protein [Peribacillus sp. TH24]
MERLLSREIERNDLSKNGEYTNDFLEWCKTYLTEEDKSMAGTYAEQSYQMELSKSPVLKLDSSRPVEVLYNEILSRLSQ